jgi:hypothetical protein
MAYTLPTAADLKNRFPEFSDIADLTIAPFLEAAQLWVDETWFERDYPYAIIYLAAHYLSLYQKALAAGATSGSTGGTGGSEVQTYLSTIAFEDFKVSFGNAGRTTSTSSSSGSVSSSAALMASTPYGALYTQIRQRNIVPMAIL